MEIKETRETSRGALFIVLCDCGKHFSYKVRLPKDMCPYCKKWVTLTELLACNGNVYNKKDFPYHKD